MSLRTVTTIAALSLLAAACGSSPATAETPAATAAAVSTTATPSTLSPQTTTAGGHAGYPIAIEAAKGRITIPAQPEYIVSLSPTSTEVLFAIGAGGQVVAVDDQSNYPSEAPTTELTGFDPNLEAIAGFGADLVIVMYDPGDVVAGLEAIGIPVIVHPAAGTLEEAYEQIRQIGAATGHTREAGDLVDMMSSEIAEIAAATDGGGATYYYELSPDYYSVTSTTFVGRLYDMVGLRNIADEADPDGYGYPQLSPEHILAEDPGLIFLADTKCCGQDRTAVAERPGWDVLRAVQGGSIVELDDDVASRWGPRVVDLFEAIAGAVDDQHDS